MLGGASVYWRAVVPAWSFQAGPRRGGFPPASRLRYNTKLLIVTCVFQLLHFERKFLPTGHVGVEFGFLLLVFADFRRGFGALVEGGVGECFSMAAMAASRWEMRASVAAASF
jgi:hypothetical protein